MIARFGMAKGTIREAMRLLQAQGLVATKTGPGGGSFVGEVTAERATRCWATTSTSATSPSPTSTRSASRWSPSWPPRWPGA
jgi:DNA-binding FadR family transcriptional regulator